MGKGVLKAVANVNDIIAPMVIGMDPTKQEDIDNVSPPTQPSYGPNLWAESSFFASVR